MLKRKWFWACILVPLYVVTWVGGWNSHAQQLRDRAEAGYRRAEFENEEGEMEARFTGYYFHPIELRKDGPTSRVNWCVPVLPGVLLADSGYSVGMGYGGEDVEVILYYGFGSTELFALWRRME